MSEVWDNLGRVNIPKELRALPKLQSKEDAKNRRVHSLARSL